VPADHGDPGDRRDVAAAAKDVRQELERDVVDRPGDDVEGDLGTRPSRRRR
jgi:hypothetical protein